VLSAKEHLTLLSLFVMALKVIMWQFCCLWRESFLSMAWRNTVNSFYWVENRVFAALFWPKNIRCRLSRKSVSSMPTGFCEHLSQLTCSLCLLK